MKICSRARCSQRGGVDITGFANSGFTLLEVLVVVVILGIFAAIAAPGWLSFRNTRDLNAAQDLAFQAMRQAQSESIRQRSTWQASFRESNGVVQLAIHSVNTLPTGANWQDVNSGVRIDAGESTLPRAGGVYRVRFNHKGHVNGQLGRLTFVSESGGRRRRCVFVSTLLGVLREARERSRPDGGGRYCY